ncbi:GIY-YIG nuclease family protein [Chromatium okenii]|uniref:GIY-YIG nuclease family protein n=1 Tax=Chromatium okenii TaxID=61644 RepID=UPI0026E9FCA7|nr:GIY-YIG nuclease family protein [Chromatium okenii]MBV5309658.1 GIY-YIG nuclease family protein [Chromatium okenii]
MVSQHPSFSSIVIDDVTIHRDAEGRYCLNDLHKASGGAVKNRPATWLQNQQTINLAKECEIDGILPIFAKPGFGTFAIKPLAVAYAAWLGGAQFISRVMLSIDDAFSILRALNEFEIPDDFPDAYVYAIRETNTGNIKLGISRNPESRLRQLQVANSGELELVAYRKAINRFQDEKNLHQLAADYRIHGEWFTAQALQFIE